MWSDDRIDHIARHNVEPYELEEVMEPPSVQNSQESVVKFYLQFQELATLNELAETRGIRQDVLVREWVLEKLQLTSM